MIAALMISHAITGQTSKFYLNNAATTSTNGDCATLQQLKVTFPIPANVGTFDCYFINLNLSSLDVPAYIFFDKAEIKAQLVGKKEFKAEVVKADGTSDFVFDDTSLTMRDLCFVPRLWKMPEVKVEVSGTGNKIVGYHWEEVWDEDGLKWISTKVEDWDAGVTSGAASMIIKQRPLSDGIEDATGFISVKPAQSEKMEFGEPEVAGAISTLSITDNSLGYPVEFVWSVYDAAEYSKETIMEELILAMNGRTKETEDGIFTERSGLFGAFMDAHAYMGAIAFDKAVSVKGKSSKSFVKATFNGTGFEHVAFRQSSYFLKETYSNKLEPGMYLNCYVTQVGNKIVLTTVKACDVIAEDYLHVSFGNESVEGPEKSAWFSSKIKDENLPQIDGLIDRILSSTTYK